MDSNHFPVSSCASTQSPTSSLVANSSDFRGHSSPVLRVSTSRTISDPSSTLSRRVSNHDRTANCDVPFGKSLCVNFPSKLEMLMSSKPSPLFLVPLLRLHHIRLQFDDVSGAASLRRSCSTLSTFDRSETKAIASLTICDPSLLYTLHAIWTGWTSTANCETLWLSLRSSCMSFVIGDLPSSGLPFRGPTFLVAAITLLRNSSGLDRDGLKRLSTPASVFVAGSVSFDS
mmetsp:Transcript_9287/g.26518  ORF Transcript_9287/g.26518 Transcript_9287/m.26518 type:complete len:230 (+) Transcript_9287:495-1184(+)